MKKSRFKHDRKRQSGTAIVEFALGATVLMYAFLGTFQWGYTFYVYNNLESAVNNGARYAAMRVYETPDQNLSSCFKNAVKNMVAYGDPSGNTTNAVAPGLTPAKVAVSATFVKGVPSTLTVSLSNYTVYAAVATTTVTNKPQMTYPFLGRFAPGETCVQ